MRNITMINGAKFSLRAKVLIAILTVVGVTSVAQAGATDPGGVERSLLTQFSVMSVQE